jgi:hypothetical protein
MAVFRDLPAEMASWTRHGFSTVRWQSRSPAVGDDVEVWAISVESPLRLVSLMVRRERQLSVFEATHHPTYAQPVSHVASAICAKATVVEFRMRTQPR